MGIPLNIENAQTKGKITIDESSKLYNCVGGILANLNVINNTVKIINCQNNVDLNIETKFLGGIVGIENSNQSKNIVLNCINTGNLTNKEAFVLILLEVLSQVLIMRKNEFFSNKRVR